MAVSSSENGELWSVWRAICHYSSAWSRKENASSKTRDSGKKSVLKPSNVEARKKFLEDENLYTTQQIEYLYPAKVSYSFNLVFVGHARRNFSTPCCMISVHECLICLYIAILVHYTVQHCWLTVRVFQNFVFPHQRCYGTPKGFGTRARLGLLSWLALACFHMRGELECIE